MMDVVKFAGKPYNVIVTALSENFNILYSEKTGRTIASGAKMTLDPLGTFYGHKVTFQRKKGCETDFDYLFDFVSQPRYQGVLVEIVHGQDVIEYEAYFSSGERALKRIDAKTGKVYWGEFTLNITPMEAQIKP